MMRTPTAPQSHIRYPLSRIFVSEGAVRVLRELDRHGGELSVPALVAATRLSSGAVRALVQDDLVAAGVVVRLASSDDPWWRNVIADALPVLGPPPAVLAQRLKTDARRAGGA